MSFFYWRALSAFFYIDIFSKENIKSTEKVVNKFENIKVSKIYVFFYYLLLILFNYKYDECGYFDWLFEQAVAKLHVVSGLFAFATNGLIALSYVKNFSI